VIEIRKARNGYVICAFMQPHGGRREHLISGFATYVVQSEDAADVGNALARVLQDYPITSDTPIPPARTLP
jgi:hypothetical protein